MPLAAKHVAIVGDAGTRNSAFRTRYMSVGNCGQSRPRNDWGFKGEGNGRMDSGTVDSFLRMLPIRDERRMENMGRRIWKETPGYVPCGTVPVFGHNYGYIRVVFDKITANFLSREPGKGEKK
jgi:hypothetical protein